MGQGYCWGGGRGPTRGLPAGVARWKGSLRAGAEVGVCRPGVRNGSPPRESVSRSRSAWKRTAKLKTRVSASMRVLGAEGGGAWDDGRLRGKASKGMPTDTWSSFRGSAESALRKTIVVFSNLAYCRPGCTDARPRSTSVGPLPAKCGRTTFRTSGVLVRPSS